MYKRQICRYLSMNYQFLLLLLITCVFPSSARPCLASATTLIRQAKNEQHRSSQLLSKSFTHASIPLLRAGTLHEVGRILLPSKAAVAIHVCSRDAVRFLAQPTLHVLALCGTEQSRLGLSARKRLTHSAWHTCTYGMVYMSCLRIIQLC